MSDESASYPVKLLFIQPQRQRPLVMLGEEDPHQLGCGPVSTTHMSAGSLLPERAGNEVV